MNQLVRFVSANLAFAILATAFLAAITGLGGCASVPVSSPASYVVSPAPVSVVGTYRLVSFVANLEDGSSINLFGTEPVGYAVITPKRFIAVLTSGAADRKAGATPDAKVALFNSLVAYSGGYEIQGNKLVTDVDVSWNQAWTGTKQGRTWTVEGDRLILVTDRGPFIRDPSKTSSGRLVWQRIE